MPPEATPGLLPILTTAPLRVYELICWLSEQLLSLHPLPYYLTNLLILHSDAHPDPPAGPLKDFSYPLN
jgi:hypothetical protein